jgi:hypothetical protein
VREREPEFDGGGKGTEGALCSAAGESRRCRFAGTVVETHDLSRGDSDLLIEVKAAAVNPSDVKAATGLMPYACFRAHPAATMRAS